MAIKIEGATSGNKLEITASGQVMVKMQTSASEPGAVYLVGKADASSPAVTGSITGSTQGLLGSGLVILEQEENFVASSLNTSKWQTSTSTMTITIAANSAIMNGGGSTTSGHYAILRSYRSVRCYRGNDRVLAWRIALDSAPVANNVVEIGGGICATTAAPTVAAIFRYGTDQTLKGVVISSNGAENSTSTIAMTTPTSYHDYLCVIGQDEVVFEIDGIPVASSSIPSGSVAPAAAESFPAYVRIYNAANTSSAQKVNVGRLVTATFGGHTGLNKMMVCALNGDVGYQHVTGTGTGGPTSNHSNSAAPGAAALSNTVPAATTLDGSLLITGPAGGETDYLLFAFQVPAGTLTNMARTLIVHGVTVDVNLHSGPPTIAACWQWQLAFGATAVSLVTTESATGKTHRRIHLGMSFFAASAPAGTVANTIDPTFHQPIPVNAGEYLCLIGRLVNGSTGGTPIYRLNYQVNASWE